MKTRCLIVDDEPLAIDAITLLLEKFPNVEVVGTCEDTFQAQEILRNTQVELIFLDIQMPEVTGLNFLRSLQDPPPVIFTTAHRQYAVEAFELDVVDYLLKPISQQRLMKALDKYYHVAAGRRPASGPVSSPESSDHMYVRADRKMVRVRFDDILFIEGLKDYVHIITKEKNIITRLTMNELEKALPAGHFLRIHRSYIVALSKITAFNQHDVEVGKEELPIGRSYRDEVLKKLDEEAR